MKKTMLFILTLFSFSSAFAMDDIVECINGRTVVSTANFMNSKNLFLTVHYLQEGALPIQATVKTSSRWKTKTWHGKASNGVGVRLVIQRFDDMKGTLYVDGKEAEDFTCKEQVFFPL